MFASVWQGRKSDRVALFFRDYISGQPGLEPEILDLMEYQFPLFNERLKLMKDPDPTVLNFAGKIKTADAIIIAPSNPWLSIAPILSLPALGAGLLAALAFPLLLAWVAAGRSDKEIANELADRIEVDLPMSALSVATL